MGFGQTNTKRLVIVTGSHRSGTSMVGGVLDALGVGFGDNLLAPKADNPKGFYEDQTILKINAETLAALDSKWSDDKWTPDILIGKESIRKVFVAALKQYIAPKMVGAGYYGFKDPRICLLFPWYIDLFKELCGDGYKQQVAIVTCFRRYDMIAKSLKKRNGIKFKNGRRLAKVYYESLLRFEGVLASGINVDYDHALADPEAFVRATCQYFKLPQTEGRINAAISRIDRRLRHHE